MKVTRNPITITLENKKEAEVMWHMLRASPLKPLIDYVKKYDSIPKQYDAIKFDMWIDFDAVYQPTIYKSKKTKKEGK